MVSVPDLSNLSVTDATTAIQNAHLNPVNGGYTNTSNSSLNNKVASQLPNANDFVEYGTDVSFIYYNYVSSPGPGPGPGPGPSAIIPTITGLAFTPNSDRTSGTLSWSGTNVDVYLFTGDSSTYPSPYNYGAYTASWPGTLVNMTPGSTYSMTITVRSSTGNQASQTISYTMPSEPTGVYYSFTYYDGKCNYAIYDSTNTQIGSYSTNYCTSRGASPYTGVSLPGCNNANCIPDSPGPGPSPTCSGSINFSNYGGLQYGSCINGSRTVTATTATRTVTLTDCSQVVTDNYSGSWSLPSESCSSSPTCTPHYTAYVYAGLQYGNCVNGTQTITATTRSNTYIDANCVEYPQPMETGSWSQGTQSCTPTGCTCSNASSINATWGSCSGATCSSGTTGTISQFTSYSTPCGLIFNSSPTGSYAWSCCATC